MKILRLISRIIVGIVFIFSGIVKSVDPLGSAYKFSDYFQAFNLEFLKPFALVLAIFLFTAEFISGFALLSGYRRKTGLWGVMILMSIFTPLTLILAITNPVSDCGCFGDAIHLTNWQTFWKNVVLMIMVVILFSGRKSIRQISTVKREWTVIITVITLLVVFSLLNMRYLQLFDFLPYKTGTNIREGMTIPEGKPADEYLTTFIYEKEGVQKEFTIENYPADDSTWKFIDQKSRLVNKGYQPPIHDFSITTTEGEVLTYQILDDPGYTVLMISAKLNKAGQKNLEKGFALGTWCAEKGISFYIVTASGTDEVKGYSTELTICTGDETTLKTIVRANPGYMLLKGGTIFGKWSWATIPPRERFTNEMTTDQVKRMNNKRPVLIVYSLILSAIVVLLLISSFFTGSKGRAES